MVKGAEIQDEQDVTLSVILGVPDPLDILLGKPSLH